MRKFLIRSSIIIGFIILLLATTGVALALFAPVLPGSILFPFQNFAEQQFRIIYHDQVSRSSYLLDLFERRVIDLNTRAGTAYELISLEYLDKSIDQATLAISLVPQEKGDKLRQRVLFLAQLADDELKQLKRVPIENRAIYITFQSKISVLIHMVSTTNVANNELSLIPSILPGNKESTSYTVDDSGSVGGLIPFPPGSEGAVHLFYPLVGKHATLACTSCHSSGKYLGTPNTCILCHILNRPIPHYNGDCAFCHTPVAWTDIHFDHNSAVAKDCRSCHAGDAPADHYNGQCSACHVAQAWNIVTFDHAVAGAVDCISCHAKVAPANHYPGQCSNCHDTSNWTSVVFDHTGFTDCISCHAENDPPNHYSGQCSNCHNTGGSWTNAHFNHSGFTDCISCHAGDAPANHFSGQCSNCHDPNSVWTNAHFNHSGFTDCISCHAGDAPANHYPGQCSNCHDPNSGWSNAHFNHSGYTDCIGCHAGNAPPNHYPGQCSNCHTTNSWSGAVFNHNGYTDCISCHAGNAPPDHYPGQCSNCHNTNSWSGAVFNHNGYTDCISCHLKDKPTDHDPGQCSNCHNTQRWGDKGNNGSPGFIIDGKLQPINCSVCHSSNIVALAEDVKQ
jgi:hypothetical protein